MPFSTIKKPPFDMKHIFRLTFLLVTAAVILSACSSDSASNPIVKQSSLQIQTAKDQWTYISLETGSVVSTCAIGDTIAQKQMAQRTDWDIALCNGMIRTNSGASGTAGGGIAKSPTDYDNLPSAISASYDTDRDTLEVY
jgi:hypothetical protein